MGKATGFLEFARKTPEKRPPAERLQDWNEMRIPQEAKEVQEQAARCMNCGIPFCHAGVLLNGMASGCPLHNLIPEWNELVYQGQWQEAYQRLIRSNPFPEFTSRVCPAPCEGACTEGYHMEAVAVNSLEYAIIERAFHEGWVRPKKARLTGKRVAIVGSGPAGLSAAHFLASVGHMVTVYERSDRAGGLLMYGIPNMKLQKDVVLRRVHLLQEMGVQFVLNTEIGKDIPAAQLAEDYDAVLLAAGATKPRGLSIPGGELSGVQYAVDFLRANTKSLLDSNLADDAYTSAKDKNVIILGGGDTGTDCVGTALRHGCKSVVQLEIMPALPEGRMHDTNPWPEWPKKQKLDYGQEEAVHMTGSDPRQYCTMATKLVGDAEGRLKELHTVEVRWENGPQPIPDTEKVWPVDILLLAMGFLGPEDTLPEGFGLERDNRSNVSADYGVFQTSADKVFAAGDMRRGQSLVVWALQEGKLAAREVDKYLMGHSAIRGR